MTDDSLRTSFDRLREIAPKLNSATDEAAKVVDAVEQFLNKECSIGIYAEVVVSGGGWNEDAERYMRDSLLLCYARCGSGFRIVVRDADGEQSDDSYDSEGRSEPTLWAQCPRDVKLQTFAHLPRLLRTIETEAGKAVRATESAASAARDILAALFPKS